MKKYRELNAQNYFEWGKSDFLNRLPSIKNELINQVSPAIDGACEEYNRIMKDKLDKRRQLFSELEADKRSNEQIKEQYDAHDRRAREAQVMIAECARIKGAL